MSIDVVFAFIDRLFNSTYRTAPHPERQTAYKAHALRKDAHVHKVARAPPRTKPRFDLPRIVAALYTSHVPHMS